MSISEYSALVNFLSNMVLSIAFTMFIIFIFGRNDSVVHKFKMCHSWFLKIALCFCTAGSLLNALCLGELPYDGMFLNLGLAMLFSWAAMFHYKRFISDKNNNKSKSKIKTTKSRKKKTLEYAK